MDSPKEAERNFLLPKAHTAFALGWLMLYFGV